MAALSDYQQLANLQQAQLGGYGALGAVIGGLFGGTGAANQTITTDSTTGTCWEDGNKYTINIQQSVIPQIQEAAKAAKLCFKSFLDELRCEIQVWHGELR